MWATSGFVPSCKVYPTPYMAGAIPLSFGPHLILSPALKARGPPERKGLCSQWADW